MLRRISTCVVGIVIAGAVGPNAARAQHSLPLELASLEWAIADSDLVVRGVVVEIAVADHWNIVTLDVRETLKGAKTQTVRFAAYRFAKGDAGLARAKQAKRELVWLLKRADAAAPGDAPEREKVLARHKLNLHAPFVPGRPGAPALPVIPLGTPQAEDDLQPPAYLTTDLRVPKTADELVQAIRTAIAQTQGQERVRSYAVALPQEIAQRTGFSRPKNLNSLIVPVDGRLEALARRLVQSPGAFLAKDEAENRRLLRLEGVKALRLLPSAQNLAIVRAWLDHPASVEPFKNDSTNLVPAGPSKQPSAAKIALPVKLADVPEIHFQRSLTKAIKSEDAQLHTAVTIDGVNFLNQRKTDGFIETLMRKRPDLAGLSFAMGDACRMKPEAGRQFVAALDVFHKAEAGASGSNVQPSAAERYYDQAAAQDRSIGQRGGADAGTRSRRRQDAPRPREVSQRAETRRCDPCPGETGRFLRRDRYPHQRGGGPKEPRCERLQRDSARWIAIPLARRRRASRPGHRRTRAQGPDPALIDVLDRPDPRAPRTEATGDKKVSVVRELVRLNHHHSCLLCHAPAARGEPAKEPSAEPDPLTAQIPLPSESLTGYGRSNNPDLLVRINVTYLRQDFSMKLPVANADPWPALTALRLPGAHPRGDGHGSPRP